MNTEIATASAIEKLAQAILDGRVTLVEKDSKATADGHRTTEWAIEVAPGKSRVVTTFVKSEGSGL